MSGCCRSGQSGRTYEFHVTLRPARSHRQSYGSRYGFYPECVVLAVDGGYSPRRGAPAAGGGRCRRSTRNGARRRSPARAWENSPQRHCAARRRSPVRGVVTPAPGLTPAPPYRRAARVDRVGEARSREMAVIDRVSLSTRVQVHGAGAVRTSSFRNRRHRSFRRDWLERDCPGRGRGDYERR